LDFLLSAVAHLFADADTVCRDPRKFYRRPVQLRLQGSYRIHHYSICRVSFAVLLLNIRRDRKLIVSPNRFVFYSRFAAAGIRRHRYRMECISAKNVPCRQQERFQPYFDKAEKPFAAADPYTGSGDMNAIGNSLQRWNGLLKSAGRKPGRFSPFSNRKE